MIKYFACSDIHSFYYEWLEALHRKGFDLNDKDHKLIICGDLFDRGDQTLECFEFAKQLAEQDRLVYVKGNHEELLEDCIANIKRFRNIGGHHISNGTVKTLAHIVGCTEYDILNRAFEWSAFERAADELMNFINKVSVDYFDLGESIFVHGWLPTTNDKDGTMIVHENWRDGDWREARWKNGMEMFNFGVQPTSDNDIGATIVCGHWHASWGWANIDKKYSEFGPDARFSSFIYNNNLGNIIALDACTVYTHFVNCVVFNDEGVMIDV